MIEDRENKIIEERIKGWTAFEYEKFLNEIDREIEKIRKKTKATDKELEIGYKILSPAPTACFIDPVIFMHEKYDEYLWNIKKEQILNIEEHFSAKPIYLKNNIYIINNADKLNKAAANTMLKFLEEPEDNILGFFITNNKEQMLDTIKSRCQIVLVNYVAGELLTSDENFSNIKELSQIYLKSLLIEKKDGIILNKMVFTESVLDRNELHNCLKFWMILFTDAIKQNIVPTLTEEQLKYVYADEADLLNVALFGKTAAQWRKENPALKGNIRDYATIEQLLVIANMESYNAILIEQNVSQSERLKQLNAMAISQLRVLQQSNSKLLAEGRKD